MFTPLTVMVAVTALALAAWCGHAAVKDQPTKDWHFAGMAFVTALTLVQVAIGVVRLARGEDPHEGTAVFVAYLIAAALAIPGTAILSLSERTRWGSATVAAGGFVLAVLQVRLHDIWVGVNA